MAPFRRPLLQSADYIRLRIANRTVPGIAGQESPDFPQREAFKKESNLVILFFPYNPHPSTSRQPPPGRSTREGLISVNFGSVWLRSAPFGSVWLRFGSVPGPFRVRFGGVGWGRGGVGERGFCKGKEYHESNHNKIESREIDPESLIRIATLGVRLHHLKCEMKSPHLVDHS